MEFLKLPVPTYRYITKEDEARTALSEIANYPQFEFDTEGTSLDPYSCQTTLFQIGTGDMVYVFDVRSDLPDVSIHGSLFKELLTSTSVLKILQNAEYDMSVLKVQYGFYIKNVYDTFIAEKLLNLGRFSKAGLQALVKKYLGFDMPKEARSTFLNYYQSFDKVQLDYAASDVCVLTTIMDQQMFEIKKHKLERVLELELGFITPLVEMELNGITLDVDKWHIIIEEAAQAEHELFFKISKTLQKVNRQATLFDVPIINISSNVQLMECLHKLGIKVPDTRKETLTDFDDYEVIRDIMEWRQVNKLVTTYGDDLIAKIHPKTGRLHTSFNQMVDTGRLSSRDPNLQNIPGKQKYRACFIALPGKVLLTADQSSAELRILGNFSEDKVFIDTYASGLDLHTVNASRIYKVPYDKVTPQQRKASKAISFGLCLHEGTQIYTNKGVLPINLLNVGDVIADDTTTHTVIDHRYMGDKECFKIVTRYGYSLEATKEHKVFVIDANGAYVEKSVGNLDVARDYLCLRKGTHIFSDFDVTFPDFVVSKNTNYKHMELPKKLNKELAAFLGLFVSEGCVQKVRGRTNHSLISFKFSNKNVQLIAAIDALFYGLFASRFTRIEQIDGVAYALNSVLFSEWLVSILDGYCSRFKSSSVQVPSCIKRAKKEIQQMFLSWLFEGDGTIKLNGATNKICYSSKSPKLVEDLQILLLNFGIVTSITKDFHKDYPGEDYYILSILGNDGVSRFMEEIGFVTDYKNSKYLGVFPVGKSYFFVPNQKAMLLNMKSLYARSRDKNAYLYDSLYNCMHVLDNKIGNKHIDCLSKYDSSGLLEFIRDNNIICLPIKSLVSVGVKPVYDISVDESERFLANGFIVHNCYGLSAHGLSARLRITKKEAEALINSYFATNVGVRKWLENARRNAVLNGYSETISGRKRFYELPASSNPDRRTIISGIERQAMNQPIQGCLSGDTIIKGVGALQDNVGEKVSVQSFGIENTGTVVYSGKQELWALTLSNGTTLKLTRKHVIPVLTNKGIRNKPLYKITKADLLLQVVKEEKLEDPFYEINPLNDKVTAYIDRKWGNKPRTREVYEFCNKVKLRNIGIGDTYDIVCDDNPHYFVANRIVVHNSNADTIKSAMIRCFNSLEPYGDRAKLILTVHDEIIVEADESVKHEVAKIMKDSIESGFKDFFTLIPMTSDTLVAPCWMKGSCEAKGSDGEKCGSLEFKFIEDSHYGTKLVCKKCGSPI